MRADVVRDDHRIAGTVDDQRLVQQGGGERPAHLADEIANDMEQQQRVVRGGLGGGDEARAFVKEETVKWREVVLKSGAKAD